MTKLELTTNRMQGIAAALGVAGFCVPNWVNAADGEIAPREFRFVVVADTPYFVNNDFCAYDQVRQLLHRSNRPHRDCQPVDQPSLDTFPRIDLVIHLGDFQKGSAKCQGKNFWKNKSREIYGLVPSYTPLIYTPGDNDWTDCDKKNSSVRELTALKKLRAAFYLGRDTDDVLAKINYKAQGKVISHENGKTEINGHPENARWRIGDVLFATFHTVATLNGRADIKEKEDKQEARRQADLRDKANEEWIKETVGIAKNDQTVRAVVLATQADPDREDHKKFPKDCEELNQPSCKVFDDLLKTLNIQAERLLNIGQPGEERQTVPVLFVHGDTGGHYLCKARDHVCIKPRNPTKTCKKYTPPPNAILRAGNLWRMNALGDYQPGALLVTFNAMDKINPFTARTLPGVGRDVTACR